MILTVFVSEKPQQNYTRSTRHLIPVSATVAHGCTQERHISHSELAQGPRLQINTFTGSFTLLLVATCYKQDLEKYRENIISLIYLNTEFKNLKVSEY